MAFDFGPVAERPTEELTPFLFRTVPVPEPEGDDDARLHDSIRAHGVTTPLMILADGRVINGRARLRHAKALGFTTVPARQLLTPVTDLEIEIFSARLALATRHLTPVQLFTMLHALSELQRERAEAGKRPRGRPRKAGLTTVSADLSKNQKRKRTDTLIGQAIGAGSTNVFKLQAIKERGSPDLFERVRRQELSIDAAYRALAPTPPAADPHRMPRTLPETLDVEIPKKLWKLSLGFKHWPRPDQERLLDMLGEFQDRLTTAIEGRRDHEDGHA